MLKEAAALAIFNTKGFEEKSVAKEAEKIAKNINTKTAI